MNRLALLGAACSGLFIIGCGDDAPSTFTNVNCTSAVTAHCIEVRGGDSEGLLEAVNSIEGDTTIVLGEGTFEMTNGISINQPRVHLIGQGMAETTLSFTNAAASVNAIDAVSNDFLVQDFTVVDSPNHAIRVGSSIGVVFRRVKTTWTTPEDTTNGPYGIYPILCTNVLIEHSETEHASDAGLYVGQSQHVIVRNNIVRYNVAGLEIENTAFADVYDNLAENNTGGILVFDMQQNPIIGRDVRIFNNTIRNNNTVNFAEVGTTVQMVPAGTGAFMLASRRVEFRNNTFEGNKTTDLAVLSGLAIDSDPANWAHDPASLIGEWDDLGLYEPGDGKIYNFRTDNIVIADNTFSGGGLNPDRNDPNMFGFLLYARFRAVDPKIAIPNVLYDTIGESNIDQTDANATSNDNHICLGGNQAASFASLDLEAQDGSGGTSPILHLPMGPFGAFNCTDFVGGPIAPVVLPGVEN